MHENTMLLISQEENLAKAWQTKFPNFQIHECRPKEIPANLPGLIILDCSTLAYKDCESLLPQLKTARLFALVMEQQLADYGALFLREGVSLLPAPLNDFGVQQIQTAAQSIESKPPTIDELVTYSSISRDLIKYAQDPAKLMQAMADAICVTMNADWVAFVRVDMHDESNPSIESLAVSQGNNDKKVHVQDIIRPDGHTLHIIRNKALVVISNAETYTLDGVPVNPQTLEWGFRAAVGLPLLRDNGAFGVMWLLYRQPRNFRYEDLRYMQVYASHAALAYSYPMQKKLAEQWQKAAQSIFARLSSAESLEAAFQQITDGIQESLHCDVVTFYPYEQRSHYLMPPYDKGATYPDALRDGESVALNSVPYEILNEPEPLVIEDLRKEERFSKTAFAQREKVASLVALPLHRGKQKVGVVFINYRKRRSFSPDEREAIKLLGEQIAISLLNTYLAGEHRRSSAEADSFLAQMEELRRQLSFMMNYIEGEANPSKQDMLESLKGIARHAYTIAQADRVTIRVADDNEISTLAIYPDEEEEYTEEERLIRLDGHSRYILEKNAPVIIPNVDDYNPALYDDIPLNPLASQLWKARIGLPLSSGERGIGVMWISFRKPRVFEHSRLRALQVFAAMAYSTRRFSTEQDWLRRVLDGLKDAHNNITSDKSEDEILRMTTELAKTVIARSPKNLYRSHLALIENQRLVYHPAHNEPEVFDLLKEKLAPDASIDLTENTACISAEVARSAQAMLIADARQNQQFLPLFQNEREGSQVAVPISVGQRLYAVLSVEHSHAYSFDWPDKAALEALASYVGLVLHNRQQELERQAYLETQKTQRDSLLELSHAAMYQFVKGHDMDNFRGLYSSSLEQGIDYAELLKKHQDLMTKPILDNVVYNEVNNAIEGINFSMNELKEIFDNLIERPLHTPELSERSELKIRDWLWESFHKDPEIHLHLEASLNEHLITLMPPYWLKAVLKILIHNGKRAARMEGSKPKEKERLVRMEATYCKGEVAGKVEIVVSNRGKTVPPAYKDYLIKRVIPRSLRLKHGGNRGIGLFMSGLILEVYEGSLSYEPQGDETRFVLRLPATKGK